MPKGKSKQTRRAEEWAKQRSEQGISWKTVFAILGSITALVGAIVNWMDFINKFREGYQQFLWLILVVLGVIWLIVLWLLFKQRNIYGILWLAVTIIGLVVIWNGRNSYVQAREAKLVVLIAKFDDTKGDYYELRDEIFDKLIEDFRSDQEIQIEKVNEIITEDVGSGSPRARNLGKSYQADLVIWGSYRQTENPNIKIHIENLSPTQFVTFKQSATLKPAIKLAELESFVFQQEIGQEASALTSFLAGVINYRADDYESAIKRFDEALARLPSSRQILENRDEIFLYKADSNFILGRYDKSIEDYDQAIRINPQYFAAYNNRGTAYLALGEYQSALQDFDKAIQINPQYFAA